MKQLNYALFYLLMITNCGLFSPREIPEPINHGDNHLFDQFNLNQIIFAADPHNTNYNDVAQFFSDNFKYEDVNSGHSYNRDELINKFNLLKNEYSDFTVSWIDSMLYSTKIGDTTSLINLCYEVSVHNGNLIQVYKGRSDFKIINGGNPKIYSWRDLPDNATGNSFFSPFY